MMVSSALSSSINPQNHHFRFGHSWSRRRQRRKSYCSIRQEANIVEPKHNQDRSRKKQTTEKAIRVPPISQEGSPPPLVNALKVSAEQNAARFHFPGHNRGRAGPPSFTQLIGLKPFVHDLPELPELDNLFCPEGPILEAQQQAAKLFGASETWFLVGGTTCGIQAAIMATCSPGDHIILPRNSHVSVISALVLSGAIPKYIMPVYDSNWDIAGEVTPSQVDKAIKDLEMQGQKASAVFVTSPTYHGICSNLSEISQICHVKGIPFIVDEAHGAHFGFQPELPLSALQQGADLAAQSTHKVLCSLTQSSMLHMSGNIVDRERVCRCLQTLQSTSPSYLLLASLDAARAQLSDNPDKIFNRAINLAYQAKSKINKISGISILKFPPVTNFPAIDPLRLTIGFQQLGLSGYEADEILYKNHDIVCELVGNQSITFVINLGTSEDDIERLVPGIEDVCSFASILGIEERSKLNVSAPFPNVKISLNPRDAFFAKKRRENIKECVGKVSGELICPYPPGIPVMIPGETISEEVVDYLLHLKGIGASISGASDPKLSSLLVCNL
ncbi:arginine decarboxylase-like [Benincasa hispida]|uniref:arginine decarboxylase-like n=1 Tax=Benincasa hispida TaxID=102211 RepID=UPI001900DA2F|nr:arginine decarboxylase-like [Benincasa hispida]